MANRRFIDFPIAASVGNNDIVLIWQDGLNKQTTKATLLQGSPQSLAGLTDVDIAALTNGQILQYNSTTSKWENVDRTDIFLSQLGDVTIVAPSNGQVLVYNSSTSKWENSSGGYVPYTGAVTTVNLGSQTIQAGSFVKAGGTSAQFLKANGSVDSTAYGTGTVTSVALTMPSAFSVGGSPITTAGTLAVTGAGLVSQYIRGDGSLADFPATTGGGSSVSYYLNGSVSQGTIGGVAYKELNRTPVFGAGTDISISADGYIASFITDALDPNKLLIPAGNWNFETYFSASSSGGTPSFYVELYKYNGTTFTLIATSSSAPELIAFGTNLNPYFSTLAVPETVLALTDRLALRYYVTHSGRTITLHTENGHLCEVITTFTTGLTALNGLTNQVQFFAVGTSGTDFAISSVTDTHTFNLPTASASNRGALSSADWTTFNNKTSNVGTVTSVGLSSATSGVTIGSTPITTSGTITLAIATASGSQNGLLSSTDWTTFNNKAPSVAGGYLPLSGGTLTGPLGGTSASFSGDITANRYRGVNSLVLNTYTTVNPASNVYLYSPGNDRDAWVYLDSADTGSNWGIYHRQIDSAVSGLPANSIGFIGAGTNTLQAWISLANGNGFFAGDLTANNLSGTNTGNVTIGTANGLSLSSQVLSLGLASGSANGALSSTDWTTFNNKQNALTNPVTGTGTTNYLAKFTGTSTVGNSALFDGGGFGGFNGTGSSSRTFVVSAASGRPLVIEAVEFGNIHSIYLRPNNSGFNLLTSNYLTGGVFLPLSLSGRENNADLVLQTGGNVTIGTTTDAGYKLDVNGTGRFSANLTASGSGNIVIQAISSNNFPLFQLQDTRVGGNTWNIEGGRTLANLQFRSSIAGGTVLELASTGAATFSSSVTAAGVGTFGRDATTVLGYFGDPNTVGNKYISFSRASAKTDIVNIQGVDAGVGGANIALQAIGGNVGIGTTIPNKKLEVTTGNGTTNGIRLTYAGGITSEGMDITYLNTGNTTTSFDSIYNSDSAIMQFRMKTAGTAVTALSILGSGSATFSNTVRATKTAKNTYGIQIAGGFYGAPRLQVYDLAADPNGYMGLGTDMSGAPYELSNYFPRTAGLGRWSVGSWAGNFGTGQYVSGYNEKLFITESAAQFNVSTSFNNDLTVLGLSGLKEVSGLYFSPNGTTVPSIAMYRAGVDAIGFSTNTTQRLIITSGGNVGINTSGPACKLHIDGPTVSYGQFRILNTTAGSGEASIHLGRSDQAIDNRWTIGQGTAGIGNDFGFYSAGNRLVIRTGGNVLIGTGTDSGDKLRVNGTTFANEIMTFNPQNDNRSGVAWRLGAATIGTDTLNRRLRVNVGGMEYYIGAVEV